MLQRRDLLTGLTGLGLGAGLALATRPAEARPAGARQADGESSETSRSEAMEAVDLILTRTGAPALGGMVVSDQGVQSILCAGRRRVGFDEAVQREDLWHIGSNTKAMTAALYGRLVDEGRARWDATLPQLFPAIAVDPAFADVTIRQVMGHRAGILDGPVMQGGFLLRAHQDKRPIAAQRRELAASLLSAPPAGPVGAFAYGNLNYVLAGAAIEQITGKSWEEAVTDQLFKPLGMTTAGFGAPTGANPWGHRPGPSGLLPVDPAGLADNPQVLGPAGRVHLDLADYGRFLRLFLTDGGGLLKPGTLQQLITPVPGAGPAYALGWGVTRPPWGQGPVLSHEGSNTMWHAVTLVAPARKLAFVGVCNAGPDASKGAARLMALHLRQRFAPDLAPPQINSPAAG